MKIADIGILFLYGMPVGIIVGLYMYLTDIITNEFGPLFLGIVTGNMFVIFGLIDHLMANPDKKSTSVM